VAGLTLFQAEGLVDAPDRIVAKGKTVRKGIIFSDIQMVFLEFHNKLR